MDSAPLDRVPEATRPKARQSEDYYLRWLWKTLYAADGVSCVCIKCSKVRRFHRVAGRRAFACDTCGSHIHPASGTLLRSSNLQLSIWFEAASLVLSSDGNIAATELASKLLITHKTAARLKAVMLRAVEEGGQDAQLLRKMWLEEQSPVDVSSAPSQRESAASAQRSHTRERITAAACHAFAERGLSQTRVADIAHAAGVSTAIIHYYFKTKDEVFLAALKWAADIFETRVIEVLETEKDHLARVRKLVDIAVPENDVLYDEYRLWLDVYAMGRLEPRLFDECTVLSASWMNCIATVVEEGARAGVFRPIAPASEIAHRVVNLLDGLSFRLVVGYAGVSAEFVRTLMSRFLAEQLGVPLTPIAART